MQDDRRQARVGVDLQGGAGEIAAVSACTHFRVERLRRAERQPVTALGPAAGFGVGVVVRFSVIVVVVRRAAWPVGV